MKILFVREEGREEKDPVVNNLKLCTQREAIASNIEMSCCLLIYTNKIRTGHELNKTLVIKPSITIIV